MGFILFREQYGSHHLQTLDVHLPSYKAETSNKTWIIFIHGGAWNDPTNSKSDGTHLLHSIVHTPENNSVCGAAINYRLSPSSKAPANDALHPDHINDVCSAIHFLQQTYRFGSNYMLIGHSCGATLALQTLSASRTSIEPPEKGVVCTEGIYDLPGLVEEYPSYFNFIDTAFGPPSVEWRDASPSSMYGWKDMRGRRIVCLQSSEDELLSMRQTEGFVRSMKERMGVLVDVEIVKGLHDEVFKRNELVEVVRRVLDEGRMDMGDLRRALG